MSIINITKCKVNKYTIVNFYKIKFKKFNLIINLKYINTRNING